MNTEGAVVSGSYFNSNNIGADINCGDIQLKQDYQVVVGNSFDGWYSQYGDIRAINVNTGADNCIVEGNAFRRYNLAADIISNNGANTIIRNNIGYATESSGTATLANTTTSIVVTHGLDVTPSAGDITVTPIEAWGAMTEFYIDTYTSTQFTIHADQDPEKDVDFAWKAIVL